MTDNLEAIEREFLEEVRKAASSEDLDKLDIKYLSRKNGALTMQLRNIKNVPEDLRSAFGKRANEIKRNMEDLLNSRRRELDGAGPEELGQDSGFDVTIPPADVISGNIHPLTRIRLEMEDIFERMGFEIIEGPEIETDYYNFEALNTPWYHPARDSQQSLYVREGVLLRTQTSAVQIRYMEKHSPPVKVVSPGRVFRADEVDATHSPMFHQMEGLYVDRNVDFSNLKHTLDSFVKLMFGKDTKSRFMPDYFPFTEPSAQVHMSCVICKGSGCGLCSNTGWIEILGCGMVDPEVFKAVGYDPEEYTGFAFGMGIERIAMIKYGIDDIRLFFENDVRFLRQIR